MQTPASAYSHFKWVRGVRRFGKFTYPPEDAVLSGVPEPRWRPQAAGLESDARYIVLLAFDGRGRVSSREYRRGHVESSPTVAALTTSPRILCLKGRAGASWIRTASYRMLEREVALREGDPCHR